MKVGNLLPVIRFLQVDGEEPLRTLKTYRWNDSLRGVTFGQNVIVLAGAGTVLERGAPLLRA